MDGVTLAIRDLEACRPDAEMTERMGFDGKWAIHPSQEPVINQPLTPSADEIARARRILDGLGDRLALIDAPDDGVLFDVDQRSDLA